MAKQITAAVGIPTIGIGWASIATGKFWSRTIYLNCFRGSLRNLCRRKRCGGKDKYAALRENSSTEPEQRPNFTGIFSVTPGFCQVEYETKNT